MLNTRSCLAINSTSRANPVCSSTRNCGVKRADSMRQLNISDFGATTSEGPLPSARRDSSMARYLRCLSHAHIVGQTAAEAELPQELHPAHAFSLVIAQLTGETLRLRGRSHALEAAQALADALERFVHSNFRLRRQQRVQQTRLVPPEAQTSPLPSCRGPRAAQSAPATPPAIGRRSRLLTGPSCLRAASPPATAADSPSHRRSPLRRLVRTSRFPNSRPPGSSRAAGTPCPRPPRANRREAARAPRAASASPPAATGPGSRSPV